MPDDPHASHDLDTMAIVTPVLTTELDLHTFVPAECADVVDEYVRAARAEGMQSVRIIHGKGKGTLREITHSVLDQHDDVASYKLGDETSGQWGATVVMLAPKRP